MTPLRCPISEETLIFILYTEFYNSDKANDKIIKLESISFLYLQQLKLLFFF
jgi:hypothetical protein